MTDKALILIVEDDKAVRNLLTAALNISTGSVSAASGPHNPHPAAPE